MVILQVYALGISQNSFLNSVMQTIQRFNPIPAPGAYGIGASTEQCRPLGNTRSS